MRKDKYISHKKIWFTTRKTENCITKGTKHNGVTLYWWSRLRKANTSNITYSIYGLISMGGGKTLWLFWIRVWAWVNLCKSETVSQISDCQKNVSLYIHNFVLIYPVLLWINLLNCYLVQIFLDKLYGIPKKILTICLYETVFARLALWTFYIIKNKLNI